MIREQEAEEVITLINRFSTYSSKGEGNKTTNAQNFTNNNVRKKRVYADTATGGWY